MPVVAWVFCALVVLSASQGECEEVPNCLCLCYDIKDANTTEVTSAYFGELGYELVLFTPYINYLHSIGKLVASVGPRGSSPFMYFSPNHTEVDIERKYCAGPYENQNAHARRTEFNFGQWAPPDYRAHYKHTSLTLDLDADKPLLIVHNKFTQEWDGPPVNFIDVATLLALFEMLTPRYTCVYIRPHPGQKLEGYAFDHSNALEFDDFQAIQEAFPQVKFFHTLLAEHRQMSFNDLQLALHSRAENYVSVLGGNAVLASYFARSNVIYAVKGQEVGNVGFEYKELYAKLSPSHNATVLHAATYKQLLELVQKQYMQS